jgi:hypothetical protein
MLALRLPEFRITGFAACLLPAPEAATPFYNLLRNGLAFESGWSVLGGHDPYPFFDAVDGQQLSVVKLVAHRKATASAFGKAGFDDDCIAVA